jgi:hypothetical protein
LRKKSEPERRRAILFISFFITVAVAVIWAVITVVRIEHMDFSIPKNSGSDVPSLSDTFSGFADRMKDIWSGVGGEN